MRQSLNRKSSSPQTTKVTMGRTATFHEVDKQQAFVGLIQQVDLVLTKHYNDLERCLSDLVEYLQPQIDRILLAKAPGILFWLSSSQL